MRLIRLVPWAFVFGLAAACGGSDSGGGGSDAGGEGGSDNVGGAPAAGGDDGSGGGDDRGIPLAEIPAEYAAALCSAYESCVGEVIELFVPGEDCVQKVTIQLQEELANLTELVDKGRVTYYPDKAQACIDELSAAGCSFLIERAPASCEAALVGTVAEGGDCELDEECEGAQYCKVGDACPGQCASLEQAGGLCTGNGDCVSGLTCGETGRCVAPAQAGEQCKQGEPDCTPGYICLGDDAAKKTPGKCLEIEATFAGKAGDACSLAEQWCGSGLVCEIDSVAPVSGKCVEKVGAGEACRAAFPDQCPGEQYCVLGGSQADPFAGTCTPKPEAGKPCGKGLGETASICAPYARCDGGVCRELAHLGEGCTLNATCYSDHCRDGACVASNSCE